MTEGRWEALVINDLWFRLRALFRRPSMQASLDEEVQAHLRMATQEHIEQGKTLEEARAAARREFGNVILVKETTRDMWGWTWLETLQQDVRHGLRQLRKNPGFTAAAVITLALGIGANATIFSVVWRPMRYHDPDRLRIVWETRPDGSRSPVSAATYLDWRAENTCFEQLAAARSASATLSGTPPALIYAGSITSNFFDTFRLSIERGRFFADTEYRPDGPRAAILSHEFWQRHFGSDASIVGRTIRLNGIPHVVVGIAPPGFEFFGAMDVWVPLTLSGAEHDRQTRDLLVVGRMKPGVTSAGVQVQMQGLAERIAREVPNTNRRWGARAQEFREALAGPGVRLMLVLLIAIVSVVLLMACANVANLLLARATTRQKEIAVRFALGASRWRVMRQLLAETLQLAIMGGALGLFLAWMAVRYLATLPVLQAPGLAPIEMNRVVLEFAAVLCLAATVLSGFVPALRTTAAKLLDHVKSSAHTTVGEHGQNRLRSGLVAGGLALSLMLMVAAGLSTRSFVRLARVDPGFPSKGRLTAHLSLPASQYGGASRVRTFYSQLLARVTAIPGVEDAAISTDLPPSTLELGQPFSLEGRDPAQPASTGVANFQTISPGYFHTFGLTLREGRAFTESDREGSPRVVIVNQRLADAYFPARDALGKRLLIPQLGQSTANPLPPVAAEIVGIVNNVKNARLNEPPNPEIYVSYQQAPATSEYLVVWSRSELGPLLAALQKALSEVDPDLPFTDVSSMDERLARSLEGGRVVVTLMVVFALMALAMGSVGLYGVISYSVTQRTSEFALRMALGASRRRIFGSVAAGALRLLAIGGALGFLLALGVARLLGGMIFSISRYDPVTFGAVGLLMLAVVLIASYVPARRAMKVDPMVALRYE